MDVFDLSTLILQVQVSLSDLPETYATDEQIYFDLKTAFKYVDDIVADDADADLAKEAIARLGAYLTYINYTSLAERKLGEVPMSMQLKVDAMRKIALIFLRRVTNLQIKDDLTIDDAIEEKILPVVACLGESFLNL
jgi:hypothetical protein